MPKEKSIKETKQNSDTVGFYESITIVWKSADRDNKKHKVKGCIFISVSANDNIPTFGDLLNKAIEVSLNFLLIIIFSIHSCQIFIIQVLI